MRTDLGLCYVYGMGYDDIRNIASIVGGDNTYRHFVKRINKEFEMADEDRNAHVYVLYQKNKAGKEVGFVVIGHSAAKMRTWEETFKEEGWVDEKFKMDWPCFELMYMYVKPKERQKGLGSKLFDKVLSFTNKEKIKGIYAYVGDKGPAAIEFYQHKGAKVLTNLSEDGVSNAFLEWKI